MNSTLCRFSRKCARMNSASICYVHSRTRLARRAWLRWAGGSDAWLAVAREFGHMWPNSAIEADNAWLGPTLPQWRRRAVIVVRVECEPWESGFRWLRRVANWQRLGSRLTQRDDCGRTRKLRVLAASTRAEKSRAALVGSLMTWNQHALGIRPALTPNPGNSVMLRQ